jgi:hypothetical protein
MEGNISDGAADVTFNDKYVDDLHLTLKLRNS